MDDGNLCPPTHLHVLLIVWRVFQIGYRCPCGNILRRDMNILVWRVGYSSGGLGGQSQCGLLTPKELKEDAGCRGETTCRITFSPLLYLITFSPRLYLITFSPRLYLITFSPRIYESASCHLKSMLDFMSETDTLQPSFFFKFEKTAHSAVEFLTVLIL